MNFENKRCEDSILPFRIMNFTALSALNQIKINREGEALRLASQMVCNLFLRLPNRFVFIRIMSFVLRKFTLAAKNMTRFCHFSKNCISGHLVLYVV